jgi:5-methylcytosine-specific restriction endonuclease McrA
MEKAAAITGLESWHGKTTGYKIHRCKCDPCAEAIKAWRLDYYARNRERISAGTSAWKAANQSTVKAAARAYREAHKAEAAEYAQAWREANRERCNEYARTARRERPEINANAKARWLAKNPDANRLANAKWRQENQDQYRAMARLNASLRRARERDALIVPFTPEQLAARMAYWGNRCYMCGGPFEAVDHVKPLTKGGAHSLSNFRPICAYHNSSKRARWHGVEWIANLTGSVPTGQSIVPLSPTLAPRRKAA